MEGVTDAVGKPFLDMLAVEMKVRIAKQHQALNAAVRFFVEVLRRLAEGLENYLRARNTDCLCRRLTAAQPLRAA